MLKMLSELPVAKSRIRTSNSRPPELYMTTRMPPTNELTVVAKWIADGGFRRAVGR